MGNTSYRLAAALWFAAGVVCVGLLTFVLVGERLDDLGALIREPGLALLVLTGAIVALLTGSLLILRPGPRTALWSAAIGVAWLLIFGSVAVSALSGSDQGPVVSSSLITVLGAAGGLVAYRARHIDLARD